MRVKDLEKMAENVSKIMNSKVESISTGSDAEDAGFVLENGYSVQYCPYMVDKFAIYLFNGIILEDFKRVKKIGDVENFFKQLTNKK